MSTPTTPENLPTFEQHFGRAPQVTASAPGRVNLLGEHTDYQGGFVLPTAIPQVTTVALGPNGTREHRVFAADLNEQSVFPVGGNAQDGFARYVAGALALGGAPDGLDVHVTSNVPMGAGLSSSAALEVAVLRGLRDLGILDASDERIALIAQRVEHEFVGVQCGIMDQMASSVANSATMLLLDTRSLERHLLPLPAGAEVLVIDSGVPRKLAESGYNERRAQVEEAARLLGVTELRDVQDPQSVEALPHPLRERARHVVSENARVQAALAADVDAARFGVLMNASHASLRDDYAVSHPRVDELVALLQAHPDVFGARMTGAGFGGAVVALVRAGQAGAVAQATLAQYGPEGRQVVP
ncbi:galactokinase [Deinococcus sp. LM3]|uniref:galactokinase n=1 Tax=Deinococcus sp. LM3 TaxID=1938608 RepID=UPI0009933D3B|nr:galactokinase [Deinococcus sp. LM3]OOV13450.1 galactokinase [Deinococcus sp. LM3]